MKCQCCGKEFSNSQDKYCVCQKCYEEAMQEAYETETDIIVLKKKEIMEKVDALLKAIKDLKKAF